MAGKFYIPFLFLILTGHVESATLVEKSYEYVMNFGKSIAPSLMSIWECLGEEQAWACAKEKAGKILDGWDEKVENERRSWQAAADAEVASSGRSFEEMPSKIGEDVETSLATLAEVFRHGVARALQPKSHHEGGGIDSITISTSDKKKMKKKKQKPPKIHLIHPVMMPMRKAQKEEKGRSFPNGRQSWVIGDTKPFVEVEDTGDVEGKEVLEGAKYLQGVVGVEGKEGIVDNENKGRGLEEWRDGKVLENENGLVEGVGLGNVAVRKGRGIMADMWTMGEKALDVLADAALDAEAKDNGVQDKSSFEEQRGKKKKKKKAILKLLILGAVLKAKIGTLLQILSFKLQVKFFIVALLGLAINLARLWIDLKNKHHHQPQKVIYYEHAQHQHHYDHEEEHDAPGWGPWSRSMDPEETDVEIDVDLQNSPYRGQARIPRPPFVRPVTA